MRKLIVVLASALALSSFAKLEKFCDVTIADSTKLVDAATKIGGFVGEPMLGMMASVMIAANPMVASLGVGPMRPGASSYLVVYADDEAKVEDDSFVEFRAVFLYPTQVGKAECRAALEGVKEVDGALCLEAVGDTALVFSDDAAKYVAITGDDKEDIALAKKALASLSKMPKLGKNEILNVHFTKFGMNKLVDFVEASEKDFQADGMIKFQMGGAEELKQIESAGVAFAVSSRGLDFKCKYSCREGSELSKQGSFMKSASPLAFAGKDAIVAMAWGENSCAPDVVKYWNEFSKLIKKWGFEPRGVKFVQEGSTVKFTLDTEALLKYITGDAKKAAAKCKNIKEAQNMQSDFMAFLANEKKFRSAKAGSVAFYVKGVSVPLTAEERFAKLMPEYANKPCLSAAVFSYYSAIKGCVLPCIEACEADKSKVAAAKKIIDLLPAANGADMAYVWGKKGNNHNVIVRINPAELNGLYKLVLAGMENFQTACGVEVDDEEDDEDDDND